MTAITATLIGLALGFIAWHVMSAARDLRAIRLIAERLDDDTNQEENNRP